MTNETKNKVHVLRPDAINSYFDPNHPEFNAHLEYERQKMRNQNLQDLIIAKDDLKQLKVLDKPTDTATRLVWIFRTIAYEHDRGKKGCYVPLSEICLGMPRVDAIHELLKIINNAGYEAYFRQHKELIGDCLEIVWG